VAKGRALSKAEADLQEGLGAEIRARRRELGITQEELAWRANMHRTYLADIERGARNVTLRSIANLAKALQIAMGNLILDAAERAGSLRREARPPAPFEKEILLVEDDPLDTELISRAFTEARLANPLKVVGDAEEGLEYLFATGRYEREQAPRPQLILLDLHLPRMSGLEFLRRIKDDGRTRGIPVAVLTMSRSDTMIEECSRLGAENYIVKPLGMEGLMKVTPKLNLQWSMHSAFDAAGKAVPA
jgi:CheY-like chemotaxis protein/DNA-binding XRE family transcriptional regulator